MDFKKIPFEYFGVILDRLTRFEPANIRYKRVFDDIINKFSIKYKLKDLSQEAQIELVEEIFNSSVEFNCDFELNDFLSELEKKYFYSNNESYLYLSSKISISAMASSIEISDCIPKNVIWLKYISNNKISCEKLRQKHSLLYPIEKIILCEGQTEYTLLNTLSRLFGFDFDKNGIMVISAGGKNQVLRKYYAMIEYCKLPIIILLDKDAQKLKEYFDFKLRKQDILYILNSGEFEDLIPVDILLKAVNYIHNTELNCIYDDFDLSLPMVRNLELIHKKYGFGEFKKAHFAQELNKYIIKNCSEVDFNNSEIASFIDKIK